jgi:transposase
VSVYPTVAADARCAARGCRCATRARAYPSDMTDAEWEILRPEAEEVMAQIRLATGRPMDHPLRPMLDAVRYLVRNGIEWRAMPVDFPPWAAVRAFYDRWSERDLPQRLSGRLRDRLREQGGRDRQPTAAIVDSQSVKSAEWAGPLEVGYDAGKRIKGIKRHLAVDVEGLLLAVVVCAADIGDRFGLKLVLIRLLDTFTRLKVIWADSGYDGVPLATWVKAVAGITLEVITRQVAHEFKVIRRRWVVERSIGWLMRYRRLCRNYERLQKNQEAMIWWANTMIMTRRLARIHHPPNPKQYQPRWGQPRPSIPTAA